MVNWVIVALCTDTYFQWARLFLRSFKLTNDNSVPIFINALRFNKDMIDELYGIYPNLTIIERSYKEKEIAKLHNVELSEVKRCRESISRGIKKDCRFWMNFLGDVRINWLYDVVEREFDSWCLHIDIDIMFRASIEPLIQQIKENDVCLKFFDWDDRDDHKVQGGMVGISGSRGLEFLKLWRDKTNHSKINSSWSWNQTNLYRTYKHFEDFKFGRIDNKWLSVEFDEGLPIWCGHKKYSLVFKGKKTRCEDRTELRNLFFKELEEMEEKKKWNVGYSTFILRKKRKAQREEREKKLKKYGRKRM